MQKYPEHFYMKNKIGKVFVKNRSVFDANQ